MYIIVNGHMHYPSVLFLYEVIYPTILIAQARLTLLGHLHKLTTCIIPLYLP